MSHDNPLIEAFEVYESLQEIEGGIMYAVADEKAFEPFDEELSRAINNLVGSSADAVRKLSPRARRARLNAIWKTISGETPKVIGAFSTSSPISGER